MSDLLFASPWWVPTCIIGIGILFFISGNKRQQPRARNTGIVIMLLAVALIALNYFVETDKEKVARHTRELVSAVQDANWDKVKSLLSPQVTLGTIKTSIYPNRDALLKGAADCAEQYQLKSAHITSLEVRQVQTQITVDLTVWTVQDITLGRPLPSSWQLVWGQTGNDWSLFQITCLSIGNENINNLDSKFLK
jgi:hypothetical protein